MAKSTEPWGSKCLHPECSPAFCSLWLLEELLAHLDVWGAVNTQAQQKQLWAQRLPGCSGAPVGASARYLGRQNRNSFLYSIWLSFFSYTQPKDLMHPASLTILFSHNNHAPYLLSQWDYLNYTRNQGIRTKRKPSNMEFQALASRWSEGWRAWRLLIAHQLGQGDPRFYHQIIQFFSVKDFQLAKYLSDTLIIIHY